MSVSPTFFSEKSGWGAHARLLFTFIYSILILSMQQSDTGFVFDHQGCGLTEEFFGTIPDTPGEAILKIFMTYLMSNNIFTYILYGLTSEFTRVYGFDNQILHPIDLIRYLAVYIHMGLVVFPSTRHYFSNDHCDSFMQQVSLKNFWILGWIKYYLSRI